MERNSWKEISSDISDVTKKIKEKVADENLVSDLKDSLNSTVESASQVLKEITDAVQNTISDEEIKNETKEVVSKINLELKGLINSLKGETSLFNSEEE